MKSATRHWSVSSSLTLLGIVVAFAATSSAFAQEHRGDEHGERAEHAERGFAHRGPERGSIRGQILDDRYNHGHYYPPRGVVVRDLPGGYRPYFFHESRYYFSGGVWYAPGPGGFLVVGAPVGLFVATLPAFYTTLWFGGAPYYYANDVYYQWQADQNGYVVVDAPQGADQPGAPPADAAPAPDNIYIYPRNGQTSEQQSADRYECHDWAKQQTGFDPTQAGGAVDPNDIGSKREQYQRAMGACLEARGYSVK